MDRVRFVHVVSDEFLRTVPRTKERFEKFSAREKKAEKKRAITEFSQLLEDLGVLTSEHFEKHPELAAYTLDVNQFRRYTYALTFPNVEDGDVNTVIVSFARQANGDQFSREFGREVTKRRLLRFLEDGHSKTNLRDGDFVFETTVSDVDAGNVNLPEKVAGTILSTQRSLLRRIEDGTISELPELPEMDDLELTAV